MPRDVRFLIGSLLLHGAVAAALLVVRANASQATTRRIEITIAKVEPRAPEPLPPPVVPPPELAPLPRGARPPRTPAPLPPPIVPTTPPPPQAPGTPPPVAPAPVVGTLRPNLFASTAIERGLDPTGMIVSARDPGGKTSRGDVDPNAPRSNADLKEEAAHRIGDMVDEDRMRMDISAGKVAPRWASASRAIEESFKPEPADVAEGSAAGSVLRGLFGQKPVSGNTPRGVDDGNAGSTAPGYGGGGFLGGMNTPTPTEGGLGDKASAIIEVVIDADGSIVSHRVVTRDSSARFARLALTTVLDKLKNGGPIEEGKAMVTRWAVKAQLRTQGINNPLGMSFDANFQSAKANYAGKRSVDTKVSLLWVRPRG